VDMLHRIERLFEPARGWQGNNSGTMRGNSHPLSLPTQSFADTLTPRIVHVPAANALRATHATTPSASASAVAAAGLSDAEAEAVRLGCHDHRGRRALAVGAAVVGFASTDTTGYHGD
jgi:hypothetical protein